MRKKGDLSDSECGRQAGDLYWDFHTPSSSVSSIQKGNSDALQPRYAEEHEAEDHIEATVHTRSPELDNRSDESR